MGTSVDNKTLDAINIISNAYLAITQNITQAVGISQVVSVNCGIESCNDCVKTWEDQFNAGKYPEVTDKDAFIRDVGCKPICNCSIDTVNLNQQVSINVDAFTSTDTSEQFKTQIMNGIYTEAKKKGVTVETGSADKLTTAISNVYNTLKSTSMQAIFHGVTSIQEVTLKGAGSVVNAKLSNLINYVSSSIQHNTAALEAANALQTQITQISSQIVEAGLLQLILYIVKIAIAIVIIIILLFIIGIVFQIYSLYVSK